MIEVVEQIKGAIPRIMLGARVLRFQQTATNVRARQVVLEKFVLRRKGAVTIAADEAGVNCPSEVAS